MREKAKNYRFFFFFFFFTCALKGFQCGEMGRVARKH